MPMPATITTGCLLVAVIAVVVSIVVDIGDDQRVH
jgi:hydroxyethylthiazole kinase-like sugar kinase family protein